MAEKKFVIKHTFNNEKTSWPWNVVKEAYDVEWTAVGVKNDGDFMFGMRCASTYPRHHRDEFSAKIEYKLRVSSGDELLCFMKSHYQYESDSNEFCEMLRVEASKIESELVDNSVTVEFEVTILEITVVKGRASKIDESD